MKRLAKLRKSLADHWLQLLLVASVCQIRIRKRFPKTGRWISRMVRGFQVAESVQVPPQQPSSAQLIAIGGVTLDMRRIGRQLRNDLKDDWFPDPLQYDDMLEGEVLTQLMRTNLASNKGQYTPTYRTLFNIPKTGFTLRESLNKSTDHAVRR